MDSNQQASGAHVSTNEIMGMFQHGDSPLDFIRKNLEAPPAGQEVKPIDPAAISATEAAARAKEAEAAQKSVEVPTEPKKETGTSQEGEDKSLEFVPATPEIQNDSSSVSDKKEEETEVVVPGAENFKALRKSLNETKAALKENERKLSEAAARVKAFETGEAYPEKLEEREREIARLRQFEKVVNLKTSAEYQEKIVRPFNGIKERLKAIAKDYNIPSNVIESTFGIESEADLNRFLEDHFDTVGALEVKQLIKQAKDIRTQAQELEKEPDSAMERFTAEAARLREERMKGNRSVMREVSNNAWATSLDKIKEEGKALELITRAGDLDHNKNIVEPIVKAAAREYGKLIYQLTENGLEKLPEELAFALARMCALAHASAVSFDTRNAAIEYAEGISKNVERSASYVRPPVGSGMAAVPPVDDLSKINTIEDASNHILNKVMGRKR